MAKVRRRRKYTWFPNLGTTQPLADDSPFQGVEFTLPGINPSQVISIAPLTYDRPSETTDTVDDENLGEIIGNEYIIERIVGSWYCNLSESSPPPIDGSTAVLVTAGIFVARADTNTGNPDLPIGSITGDEAIHNYSPQHVDNTREPWMFRRTWMLGCPYPSAAGDGVLLTNNTSPNPQISFTRRAYPQSNVGYGDSMSGSHVDVRSVRRVADDERLFAVLTAQMWPSNVQTESDTVVVSYFDYRILGALRKARGKSSF